MGHFVEKCMHGSIISQCRCPDKNKIIRWSKCIFYSCKEENRPLDPEWPNPHVVVELQQAADKEVATQNIIKSLHLLMAKMHQELAGEQVLVPEEMELIDDISNWYEQYRRKEPTVARDPRFEG